MTFLAKYLTVCPACHRPIKPGDMLVWDVYVAVHEGCFDDAVQA